MSSPIGPAGEGTGAGNMHGLEGGPQFASGGPSGGFPGELMGRIMGMDKGRGVELRQGQPVSGGSFGGKASYDDTGDGGGGRRRGGGGGRRRSGGGGGGGRRGRTSFKARDPDDATGSVKRGSSKDDGEGGSPRVRALRETLKGAPDWAQRYSGAPARSEYPPLPPDQQYIVDNPSTRNQNKFDSRFGRNAMRRSYAAYDTGGMSNAKTLAADALKYAADPERNPQKPVEATNDDQAMLDYVRRSMGADAGIPLPRARPQVPVQAPVQTQAPDPEPEPTVPQAQDLPAPKPAEAKPSSGIMDAVGNWIMNRIKEGM